jgi:glycosyltransferase involved in cell wall biosynthesis
MEVLKVMHVGCPYHPYKGGSTVRLSSFVNNMKDHETYILTGQVGKEEDSDYHGAKKVFRFPLNSLIGIRKWRSLVAQLSPDAVVLHNSRVLLMWALFIDPFHRVRRVHEIHNFRDNTFAKFALNFILYRLCDAIVVLGKQAEITLLNRYRLATSAVRIIRNGYECDPCNPEIDPKNIVLSGGKINFVYAGTLYDWQGVNVIAEALTKLDPSVFKKAHFTIIGDGPEMSTIKCLLHRHIEQNNVSILGWLEKHLVDSYQAQAAVILMPRISTPGTETIVPLKAVEVCRNKKKIIASSVGGLVEVFGGEGHQYLQPGNVDDLVSAISKFVLHGDATKIISADPSMLERSGICAWDVAAADYRRLLGSKNA